MHAVLRCSSQREYLHGKLRDLESRIASSRSQRQATDREKRLAAAAAKLKKEVPGGGTTHPWQWLQAMVNQAWCIDVCCGLRTDVWPTQPGFDFNSMQVLKAHYV